MGRAADDELIEALHGARPPASLGDVDETVVSELAAAIVAAHRDQTRQLAASQDKSLEVIPRLLRGPVKKVLGL